VGPSQWRTASRCEGFSESREKEEFRRYSAEKEKIKESEEPFTKVVHEV
jgi:hypothetical protein